MVVKFKICIVEDQINMRKAMCRLFLADGHQVFDFASAPDAIEFLTRNHVDVVVSDIYLEKGSGIDVLRHVRGRALLNDLPVVFVTGEGTRDDIVHAIDAGASDYVLKPFEIAELHTKVIGAVEKFLKPTERELTLRLAEASLLDGDLKAAHRQFQAAQQLTSRDGAAHPSPRVSVGLARLHMLEGDLSATMRLLRKTMTDHPLHFPAHALMADVLLAQDRRHEATEALEQELEIHGKQPQRRLLVAKLLAEQGEHEKALGHVRQAILDHPKDERLLLTMASLYRGMGDRDKAIHYYLKTRRGAGRSLEALRGLVDVCAESSDWARARQLLTDQLKADRSDSDIYLFRSRVLERMVLVADALVDAEAYLAARPEDTEALRFKARCLLKLGRVPEQCEVLARVCDLDSNGENEGKAGLANLKGGRYAQAVQHYTRAVQLDPESTKYRYNLAFALQHVGQIDRAKAVLKSVLKIESDHQAAQALLSRLSA